MKTLTGETIAVFGDWHGNTDFAVAALEYVYNNTPVDAYFHVGDFGFWPVGNEERWNLDYLPRLEQLLTAQARELFFVDGNHEHFTWLDSFPLDKDGLRRVSEHIFHIPRGQAISVAGKKIVGFGGAHSTDRKARVKDYSWFSRELITESDVAKALENGSADVLITHEAPVLQTRLSTGDLELDRAIEAQRSFVAEVAVRLQAKLLIHGHHHRAYIDSYRGTEVIGLGHDALTITQTSIDLNHVVVELKEV